MKTIPPLLVLLAIIAFFTPWFSIWMVAGRELDQERHWKASIDSIHREAFQIGESDRVWKKQNTERMNEDSHPSSKAEGTQSEPRLSSYE